MKPFSLLASVLVGLAFCSQSYATIITDVVAGPASPGVTLGATMFNHLATGDGSTPGPSVNTISLNAAVESGYIATTPLNWTIDFVDADGDVNVNGNTKYLVTLNLANNGASPLFYQVFRLSSPNENLNLFGPATAGPNSFISSSSPAPTSTFSMLSGNSLSSGTGILAFASPGGIAPGDAGVFSFTLDLADYFNGSNTSVVAGSFVLSMVANPEPTSLVLAGLTMSMTGGASFYRRRRMKRLGLVA